MVSLRSSCYRFLWGIVPGTPLLARSLREPCAKLARTLREPCANLAQNSGCVKSSRVKITRNSCLHCLLPFKIHDIHSKSCLLKLTIPLQARGPTYQANNATRKQRNSSPISSRPIMLCNPFGCIHSFLFQLST